MMSKDFRPDREVLLEENPPHPMPSAEPRMRSFAPRGGGRASGVNLLSKTNNRLVLGTKADGNCLLVLSDTYYPGWKAFVDGKETKIYRADYTFRGIPLSAGTHQVEFVYDPLSFKLGIGATILGILGCVGLGWVGRRKRAVVSKPPDPLL
jgi:hypothetical protein